MPFKPGVPDSLSTRNDDNDGQGIDIDSSVENRNRISFYTGSENDAPPYAPLAVPVPPANIEVSQVTGGYADMSFNGPTNYDGSRQAQIRMGANIGTMHANNNTTIDVQADQIKIGTGSLPVPSGSHPQVRIASSNRTVIKGSTGTVISGRLEDHDENSIGYLGTRFGAHKRWDRIASGSLAPWYNGNTRHGISINNTDAQIYWDGGPLVFMQFHYDTGPAGFAAGPLVMTPQDLNFQVNGGNETTKLTLPSLPSSGVGRGLAGSVVALAPGVQWASRVQPWLGQSSGYAGGRPCIAFLYGDNVQAINMVPDLPFAWPRLIISGSIVFPIT